jgi:hypothetical protein
LDVWSSPKRRFFSSTRGTQLKIVHDLGSGEFSLVQQNVLLDRSEGGA